MKKVDVFAGGVYRITCLPTKRIYIGSAKTLLTRFAAHIIHLNRSGHQNRDLQADWDSYGQDAFCFHIVKIVNDRADRLALEQHLIKSSKRQLYNVNRCGPREIGYASRSASNEVSA